MVSFATASVILDEQIIVERDDHAYMELSGKKGGSLEIDVKVIEGDPIDLFMMNQTNFQIYLKKGDFDYYEKGSALNIYSKKYTFEAPETADYIFVVDNSELGIAYSFSSVQVRIVITDLGMPFVGAYGILLAFMVAVLYMGIGGGSRKRGD
jgi:hypothetical protein